MKIKQEAATQYFVIPDSYLHISITSQWIL